MHNLDYSSIFCLICFIAGIWQYKLLNLSDKIILWIVSIYIVADILMVRFGYNLSARIQILNLANIVKFSSFFLYFYLKAPQSFVRKTSIVLVPVFIIWGLINFNFFQGTNTNNTLTFIPAALIIGVFSYMNLRRVIIADAISKHNFQLWLLIATCLLFFVTIPIEGMGPFIIKFSPHLAHNLTQVLVFFETVWMIFITLGFLWKKPSRI